MTLAALASDTLLFTLRTHDRTSKHHGVPFPMFADDMTITDPIQDGDESAFQQELELLLLCCSQNKLKLETVDFWKQPPSPLLLAINTSRVSAISAMEMSPSTDH